MFSRIIAFLFIAALGMTALAALGSRIPAPHRVWNSPLLLASPPRLLVSLVLQETFGCFGEFNIMSGALLNATTDISENCVSNAAKQVCDASVTFLGAFKAAIEFVAKAQFSGDRCTTAISVEEQYVALVALLAQLKCSSITVQQLVAYEAALSTTFTAMCPGL
ncbi:hypothetical protein BDZ89DRAFT_1154425 [Hymenopellis radicata]|nr:hypothetical protein BDZ89DRAFT_1154425 [Hymenopellis radicata]